MRIAICDDEAVFRTYLRDILVKDSLARGTDIQVAEYADGEALLEALEAPDDYVGSVPGHPHARDGRAGDGQGPAAERGEVHDRLPDQPFGICQEGV